MGLLLLLPLFVGRHHPLERRCEDFGPQRKRNRLAMAGASNATGVVAMLADGGYRCRWCQWEGPHRHRYRCSGSHWVCGRTSRYQLLQLELLLLLLKQQQLLLG